MGAYFSNSQLLKRHISGSMGAYFLIGAHFPVNTVMKEGSPNLKEIACLYSGYKDWYEIARWKLPERLNIDSLYNYQSLLY